MSDERRDRHVWGLDALRREHLEHVQEFQLLSGTAERGPYLTLIMEDGADVDDISLELTVTSAVEVLVKMWALWVGHEFVGQREGDLFIWRRL